MIYTNYFGWCQEQNPSLHWFQVGMPIRLWANDKDTWSRFLSLCGWIACGAQSLHTGDEECLFTYKIYDKGTPAFRIFQDHRLHGLTLPLFCLPTCCQKYPGQSNWWENVFIWLTMPGSSSSLWESQKGRNLEQLLSYICSQEQRAANPCITQFRIPHLGNGATHSRRVFPS